MQINAQRVYNYPLYNSFKDRAKFHVNQRDLMPQKT